MIAPDPLPEPARQVVTDLTEKIARLEQIILLKNEQIRLLTLRLFGAKGEKLSEGQIVMLLDEISVTAAEVEKEADRPVAEKVLSVPQAKAPRANHPGREELPKHLERREEIIPCHPDACRCGQCGSELPKIGYETREELACTPAVYFVRVIKREKRGSHCLPEQGVVTAPVPAQIVPKSKLSNEFIIDVLVKKYQQHLPVYRQQAILAEEHGIELSRKTLTDAVLAGGGLLTAVTRAQRLELLAKGYLQADETPMPCQTGTKTGKNHRAYMWEYSVPGGPVVFDFQMGRGRAGPAAFLKGYQGILQCDGYSAYAELGEGIVYAGCMAHARRGFVEAGKVAPQDPLPPEILAHFAELYAVEKFAREASMTPAERLSQRQARSVPRMQALKQRLVAIRQQVIPGGTLAKACDYTLNQWNRLEVYLEDGRVEIDNNWCYAAHGITPVMPPRVLCRVAGKVLRFPRKLSVLKIADAA